MRPGPIVTVVVASFQSEKYLSDTIRSLTAQTFGALEILIADDGSTDASPAIAKDFARSDARIRVLENTRNTGASAARNRAIEAASGDWIAIVDSDDIVHPERFERLLEFARQTEADVVADNLIYFSQDGYAGPHTLFGGWEPARRDAVDADLFIRAGTPGSGLPPLGYLKPLFRRSRLGGMRYDETVPVGEDYDLLLRFLLSGGRLSLTPQAYYLYRRHARSISHRLSEAKVRAMIDNQNALVGERTALPQTTRRAFDARLRQLRAGLAFERLVASIKARKPASAIAVLARRPSLGLSLMRAYREHRAAGGREAEIAERHRRKDVVVFHPVDRARPDGHPVHAAEAGVEEFVAVPAYRPVGSPSDSFGEAAAFDAAEWAERAMRDDLTVIAHGLAGAFALCLLPRVAKAVIVADDGSEIEAILRLAAGRDVHLVVPARDASGQAGTRPFCSGYERLMSDDHRTEVASASAGGAGQ